MTLPAGDSLPGVLILLNLARGNTLMVRGEKKGKGTKHWRITEHRKRRREKWRRLLFIPASYVVYYSVEFLKVFIFL